MGLTMHLLNTYLSYFIYLMSVKQSIMNVRYKRLSSMNKKMSNLSLTIFHRSTAILNMVIARRAILRIARRSNLACGP